MKTREFFFVLLVIIIIMATIFFSLAKANAESVTLAWDDNNPAPEGYRLFMRIEGEDYNYDAPKWTGTATTTTIDGLLPATSYYFVVRAYVAKDESGDSNEVGYKPPVPVPQNLRLQQEISVYIDDNGKVTMISKLTNVITQ